MAAEETTLTVAPREIEGSRATRRLRRSGFVPGIVYGGDADPAPFQVGARELRNALAHGGAVIQLTLDGTQIPVVLKDHHRHPVTGDMLHVDMLRVDLKKKIHATVVVELVNADDAPGIRGGGVLEQVTREINIEALPNEIPDLIELDVSNVEVGDTVYLSALKAPEGVELLDDLEETVLASVLAPKLSVESEDEIETETEVASDKPAESASEGDSE
ncbi:50S ribosomal protein L25 [Conexibacter sp. JD483]|uniref:50S ribosomal protein L25 n=1 Tax=unclassified Conexibacter TaxID=2627773 RepID=UPI00271872CF|nr:MULTISPECIES: 50S ribosomal protein L25 [unclassified Conexibacter]MDO8185932.1 50S ribosomal protein L25 [Conexibacter sp. CPCC 205706]MDO8199423.1 50S ribosomal protein L25 [Conexibacter sp. CPCC 205762]MDR9368542.1 50S ribosomal protein L25 [Conexibacter sp. JD483]